MNLERYSEEDKRVIEQYFECLRDGRLTGKVSPAILEREVKYWEKFSVDVVIEALRIHIRDYPAHRESYTRGIMRNLQNQGFRRKPQRRAQEYRDPSRAGQEMDEELRKELELLNDLREDWAEDE
ncbi:MAG: hypothetical protein Q3993_04685 [Filifactor alocis]|nr:hypothetical protein [Filifactor alocis]